MQKGRDREEKEGKRQMGELEGRDKPLLPFTSAKIKECKNTSAKKEREKLRITKAQNLKPKSNTKVQARRVPPGSMEVQAQSLKKARAQLCLLHLTKISDNGTGRDMTFDWAWSGLVG